MLPLKMTPYLANAVHPVLVFFESPCLGFCLCCCISVPGCSSILVMLTYIGVSFSLITFVFDLLMFRTWLYFHKLILVIFDVAHVVYTHI